MLLKRRCEGLVDGFSAVQVLLLGSHSKVESSAQTTTRRLRSVSNAAVGVLQYEGPLVRLRLPFWLHFPFWYCQKSVMTSVSFCPPNR